MSKHNKGGWNKQIKNDPDFHKKFELNEKPNGPTFIPRKSTSYSKSDEYHPSNPSFNDFGNLAHEGAADDL